MIKEALKYSLLTTLTICSVMLLVAILFWCNPAMQEALINFLGETDYVKPFSFDILLKSSLILLFIIAPCLWMIVFATFIGLYNTEVSDE